MNYNILLYNVLGIILSIYSGNSTQIYLKDNTDNNDSTNETGPSTYKLAKSEIPSHLSSNLQEKSLHNNPISQIHSNGSYFLKPGSHRVANSTLHARSQSIRDNTSLFTYGHQIIPRMFPLSKVFNNGTDNIPPKSTMPAPNSYPPSQSYRAKDGEYFSTIQNNFKWNDYSTNQEKNNKGSVSSSTTQNQAALTNYKNDKSVTNASNPSHIHYVNEDTLHKHQIHDISNNYRQNEAYRNTGSAFFGNSQNTAMPQDYLASEPVTNNFNLIQTHYVNEYDKLIQEPQTHDNSNTYHQIKAYKKTGSGFLTNSQNGRESSNYKESQPLPKNFKLSPTYNVNGHNAVLQSPQIHDISSNYRQNEAYRNINSASLTNTQKDAVYQNYEENRPVPNNFDLSPTHNVNGHNTLLQSPQIHDILSNYRQNEAYRNTNTASLTNTRKATVSRDYNENLPIINTFKPSQSYYVNGNETQLYKPHVDDISSDHLENTAYGNIYMRPFFESPNFSTSRNYYQNQSQSNSDGSLFPKSNKSTISNTYTQNQSFINKDRPKHLRNQQQATYNNYPQYQAYTNGDVNLPAKPQNLAKSNDFFQNIGYEDNDPNFFTKNQPNHTHYEPYDLNDGDPFKKADFQTVKYIYPMNQSLSGNAGYMSNKLGINQAQFKINFTKPVLTPFNKMSPIFNYSSLPNPDIKIPKLPLTSNIDARFASPTTGDFQGAYIDSSIFGTDFDTEGFSISPTGLLITKPASMSFVAAGDSYSSGYSTGYSSGYSSGGYSSGGYISGGYSSGGYISGGHSSSDVYTNSFISSGMSSFGAVAIPQYNYDSHYSFQSNKTSSPFTNTTFLPPTTRRPPLTHPPPPPLANLPPPPLAYTPPRPTRPPFATRPFYRPSEYPKIPPVPSPHFCAEPYKKPRVPDFRTAARRISDIKCYEYIWELRERNTKEFIDEYCDRFPRRTKRTPLGNFQQWSPDALMSRYESAPSELNGTTTRTYQQTRSGFIRAAQPEEFPHMAAIGWRGVSDAYVFKCGGSLISRNFVLTAAHCTASAPDPKITDRVPRIVRIGDTNIGFLVNGQISQKRRRRRRQARDPGRLDVGITNIIIHERYNPSLKYFDIALLELEYILEFNKHLQPACLWTDPNTSGRIKKAIATGWGVTDFVSSQSTPYLQAGELDVVDSQTCNRLLQPSFGWRFWQVVYHQLCAGKLSGGVDVCQGDSGGPLQVKIRLPIKTQGSMHTILGIISAGVKCGRANTPGIYTRVTAFVDWIESYVWPQESLGPV